MRLYVGSREIKPDGYLSVDIDPKNKPDIVADIMDMRSVADGSCVEIVASHVLEHLAWPDSFRALAEFARVLTPNGILKISVPDMRLLLDMLVSGESDYHAAGILFGVGGRTNQFEQHRYGFTESMLRRILALLGFGDFDWWNSSLPEGANGWCPGNGEARVAVSLNLAARKVGSPLVDPSIVYEMLSRQPLDDPVNAAAGVLAQDSHAPLSATGIDVYQRIHFQLIEARQRIKYLEDEIHRMREGNDE